MDDLSSKKIFSVSQVKIFFGFYSRDFDFDT